MASGDGVDVGFDHLGPSHVTDESDPVREPQAERALQ